jgi:hypothetical protein
MDNAYDGKGDANRKVWEWHNTDINKGYQAAHVIRQPGLQQASNEKFVDLSKPQATSRTHDETEDRVSSKKKSKHEKSSNKSSKNDKKKRDKKKHDQPKQSFNPILQHFVLQISESTMKF